MVVVVESLCMLVVVELAGFIVVVFAAAVVVVSAGEMVDVVETFCTVVVEVVVSPGTVVPAALKTQKVIFGPASAGEDQALSSLR